MSVFVGLVIPAQAGIQFRAATHRAPTWFPPARERQIVSLSSALSVVNRPEVDP